MSRFIPNERTPERKMMDRAASEARMRRDFKTAHRIEAEIRSYENDRKRAYDREKQKRADQIEGYVKGAAIVGGVYAASKAADVLGKENSFVSSLVGMCGMIALGMTAWTFITEGPEAFRAQEEPAAVEIVGPAKPTLSPYELQIREAEAHRNFEEPVKECVTPEIVGDEVVIHRYEC